ncbi:MAG TPA: thiamine diphosphokinase, partial [Anaerolineaceae bacterium]|nr:thiamine diphosphokinase [Anaerolineaceae bacterium]
MSINHVLVFANGELMDPRAAREMATRADWIIAADGGLAHVQALNLKPDLLVGDLDSVSPEQIRWAEKMGAEVRRFPLDKDETDLELALQEAVATGCSRITITGALGGRLDQTLSNIYLLNLPVLADLDVRIDDGAQEVILI